MTDVERAVERLTQMHTEYEGGMAVERSPLLIELAESATVQDGRGSGSGGVGIPINLGVIAVQDHIKKRLGALRGWLGLAPTKDALTGTSEAWTYAKTEWAGQRMTEEAWARIEDEFPNWVRRITEEVSPPTSTEMVTPCPECGETRAFLRGDNVTAVVIKWYPEELDRAPIANCRFCGHEWIGWGAMHYDLETVNHEALATLGIDVASFARAGVIPSR